MIWPWQKRRAQFEGLVAAQGEAIYELQRRVAVLESRLIGPAKTPRWLHPSTDDLEQGEHRRARENLRREDEPGPASIWDDEPEPTKPLAKDRLFGPAAPRKPPWLR